MDFFIIIGGIIFCIVRAIRNYKDKIEEGRSNEMYDRFINLYQVPRGDAEALMIRLKDTSQHAEIIEGLRDVWISAFGEEFDYKNEVTIEPWRVDRLWFFDKKKINWEYWIYHILLAQMGKFDHERLIMGYSLGFEDVASYHIKLCREIERAIRLAGVDTRLVLGYRGREGYRRYSNTMNFSQLTYHKPQPGINILW